MVLVLIWLWNWTQTDYTQRKIWGVNSHPVLERRPGSLVPDRFSGRGNGTSGFLHDDPGTRPTRVVTLRKCSSKYTTPLVTRLDGRETGPIRQRAEGGVSPRPSDLGYHYICTLQLQWKNTSSRHSTTPFRPHAPAPTPWSFSGSQPNASSVNMKILRWEKNKKKKEKKMIRYNCFS